MQIGEKLKEARKKNNLTQEFVADKINVSRQTISNWENEKSYPDILSIIQLSDIYNISLDTLLKGDIQMLEHLEESTNTVKSNKKLIVAILVNIILFILFVSLNFVLEAGMYYIIAVFCLTIISTTYLLYQIIKKL